MSLNQTQLSTDKSIIKNVELLNMFLNFFFSTFQTLNFLKPFSYFEKGF